MFRFFISCIFLILSAGLAQAKCNGRDLLAGQSASVLQQLESAAARNPFHEGRYFKVTKDGVSSHIIGTLHFDDPQIRKIPKYFKTQIDSADALLVEIEIDEAADLFMHFLSNPRIIINSDGPSLDSYFKSDEWETITRSLAKKRIPADFVSQLEPWFVANALSDIPCTNRSGRILDVELMKYATRRDVPIVGMETKEDLIPLVAGSSDEEAIQNIRLALHYMKYGEDLATTIKLLYQRGEIAKIVEFGNAFARRILSNEFVAESAYKFEQRVLTNRNKAWMSTLLPAAHKGNVVVAVGAAHLYGTNGLLRLLERQGFTIQRIKLN